MTVARGSLPLQKNSGWNCQKYLPNFIFYSPPYLEANITFQRQIHPCLWHDHQEPEGLSLVWPATRLFFRWGQSSHHVFESTGCLTWERSSQADQGNGVFPQTHHLEGMQWMRQHNVKRQEKGAEIASLCQLCFFPLQNLATFELCLFIFKWALSSWLRTITLILISSPLPQYYSALFLYLSEKVASMLSNVCGLCGPILILLKWTKGGTDFLISGFWFF